VKEKKKEEGGVLRSLVPKDKSKIEILTEFPGVTFVEAVGSAVQHHGVLVASLPVLKVWKSCQKRTDPAKAAQDQQDIQAIDAAIRKRV
jgi:hypothetical protein